MTISRLFLSVSLFILPNHLFSQTTINIPADQSTIQAGLNAALNGDTVLVQPGTYYENIIWPDVNGIKLISAGDSSDTIIDGGGVSSVIYMNPATATIDTTTEIQGFMLTHGGGVLSGGGMVIINASPELNKINFIDNEANTEGGTLYIINSDLKMSNILIIGSRLINTSYDAKGGGIYFSECNPRMLNVVIKNSDLPGSVSGGGIYSNETSIENVSFENITGTRNGGGIYLTGNTNQSIRNCSFKNIDSWSLGHAIYIYPVSRDIYNCTFSDFLQPLAPNDNACIVYRGNIIRSKFYNNTQYAALEFGQIDSTTFANSAVGPLVSGRSSTTTISNSSFSNLNQAITLYDDPIFLTPFQYCTFNNNQILINESDAKWSFEYSNITNNGGVYFGNNISPLDAINNYWGHLSGPYHPSQNPTGQGDSVNAFVNVTPWLTIPDITAPPIPAQNLTTTGTGNDFINLSWDSSPLGDFAGFKLYYDSDSSGYPYSTSIDVGTVTSYQLTGLTGSTTYYLGVTVYDTDGNESWYSNEVVAATRILEIQNLDIGGDEDLQHLISHSPTISFDYYDSMTQPQSSYQIQVSSRSDYSTLDLWDSGEITSAAISVLYAGSSLIDGKTYYLRVKVSSGGFWSSWSNLQFRMNSEPSDPVPTSPIGDEVSGTPVTLESLNSTDPEGDPITLSFRLYDGATFATRLDSTIDISQGTDTTRWNPTASLSDNGQYWWTVTAFDGYEFSDGITAQSFLLNIANDPPSSFLLLSPSDVSELTALTPLLDWATSIDPDPIDTVKYRLYLGSTIKNLETINVDTFTTYQVPTNLTDNTTYYWKVVAFDLSGAMTVNTDGYHSFYVNSNNDLPDPFALISPPNTGMVTDLTPVFHWRESSDVEAGTVSYKFYLSTDQTFAAVTLADISTTSYTQPTALNEDQTYYWKVVATDFDGGETTSEVWSFWTNSQNSAPTAFSTTTPADQSVLTTLLPAFGWASSSDNDMNDAVTYSLHLGSSPQLQSEVYSGSNPNYVETVGLVDNTTYYWRVVATDLSGATTRNTGGIKSFTINMANDPPSIVQLVSPSDSSHEVTLSPEFHWTESTDPDPGDVISYTLKYWANPVSITSISSATSGLVPTAPLSDNSFYHWTVVSSDNESSAESDTSMFWTDTYPEPPLSFLTISPADNEQGLAGEVEFKWNIAEDSDPLDFSTYNLIYATDWADNSTHIDQRHYELPLGDN